MSNEGKKVAETTARMEQIKREGHKPESDSARHLLRRAVLNEVVRKQMGQFWVDAVSLLLSDPASQVGRRAPVQYTYGHCQERNKPGGCQLHNLQCGYPDCDRRAALATSPPVKCADCGNAAHPQTACIEYDADDCSPPKAEPPLPQMVANCAELIRSGKHELYPYRAEQPKAAQVGDELTESIILRLTTLHRDLHDTQQHDDAELITAAIQRLRQSRDASNGSAQNQP